MDMTELELSLNEYHTQLQQIETIIQSTTGSALKDLHKLASDIRDLILLTEHSIAALSSGQSQKADEDNVTEEFDEEYAKFKAEIGELEAEAEPTNATTSSAKDFEIPELSALEGQKCRAPFTHSWGTFAYHNAMILSVEPVDFSDAVPDIEVRVLYLLPVHESMKTCKYFLENKCHYEADECRFSHSQVVSLKDLRDYEEPNFTRLKPTSKILCRYAADDLWYRATIQSVKDGGNVVVRYEEYPNDDAEVGVEDVWPLGSDDGDSSSDDEFSEAADVSGFASNAPVEEETEPEIVRTDLLLQNGSFSALGEWEKYTKGFGSKMMTKLGYIMGTGLGKQGEGRIDPVDAVVLPPGRSLDRCMELREKSGGENLLSVEKRLKRQQMAAERRDKREQERAESSQNHFMSLFDVLNSRLGHVEKKDPVAPKLNRKESATKLRQESSKNLNIQNFKISEDIRRCDKELDKLQESLKRQAARSDQKAVQNLQRQIQAKENELKQLRNSEKAVNQEQNARSAKKKMRIF